MLTAMPILQVRDVPEEVIATLRDRAEASGVSLSAYVRRILAAEAEAEPMEEVIARIQSREPVEVTGEEILAAIREGRR
jgi:plasmid stability protein